MPVTQIYKARLKNGRCPQCGRKRDNGTIYCEICIKKADRRVRNGLSKKQNRRNMKRLYNNRRSLGLCPKCGKPTDGHIYCEKHRQENNELVRQYQYRRDLLAVTNQR